MGGSSNDAIHATADREPPVRRVGRLNNWSVGHHRPDPYKAPEQLPIILRGEADGHPDHPDGRFIRTSRVVAASGLFVTTASGSLYELGTPDPEYVEWLSAEGIAWDPTHPIRITTVPDPEPDDAGGVGP